MRPLDIAWTLLKALPEQRERADKPHLSSLGRQGSPHFSSPGSPHHADPQHEGADMGTIHPGALSAMHRLQKPSSYVGRTYDDTGQVMDPGKLDTRSYGEQLQTEQMPPGLLMGNQHDRAVSRTGTPRPDTRFYNPETGMLEQYDGGNPNRGNVRTDHYQESITPI